jgi:hypothetical protein
VLAAVAGRDIFIKRADRHAINHCVMHQQARWDSAESGSYLITSVKHSSASLVPGWEWSALEYISMSLFILTHAFGFDSLRLKWNAPIFPIIMTLNEYL